MRTRDSHGIALAVLLLLIGVYVVGVPKEAGAAPPPSGPTGTSHTSVGPAPLVPRWLQ